MLRLEDGIERISVPTPLLSKIASLADLDSFGVFGLSGCRPLRSFPDTDPIGIGCGCTLERTGFSACCGSWEGDSSGSC